MSALYDLAFPRFRPPREDARVDTRAARITWLGTAAHAIATARTTVLVDPYVSRHGLRQVAGKRLEPDDEAIARWIPKKVDAILCGHSHYDHLLDAPRIARKTGARLVGSASTCAFGRAEGVPESQLVEVPPHGARVEIGDVAIRFVPSKHGRIAFGRVPFPGEVRRAPRLLVDVDAIEIDERLTRGLFETRRRHGVIGRGGEEVESRPRVAHALVDVARERNHAAVARVTSRELGARTRGGLGRFENRRDLCVVRRSRGPRRRSLGAFRLVGFVGRLERSSAWRGTTAERGSRRRDVVERAKLAVRGASRAKRRRDPNCAMHRP